MRNKILVSASVMISLVACQELSVYQEKLATSRIERFTNNCIMYGFKPDTDSFGNCMIQQDEGYKNRSVQFNKTSASSPYLLQYYPIQRSGNTIQCRSVRTGNYTNTDCN